MNPKFEGTLGRIKVDTGLSAYKEQVIDKQVEPMIKKDIWRKSIYSPKE